MLMFFSVFNDLLVALTFNTELQSRPSRSGC